MLPGAVIRYGEKEAGINLLKGTKSYGTSPEELARLYNDVELPRYRFASAIQRSCPPTVRWSRMPWVMVKAGGIMWTMR